MIQSGLFAGGRDLLPEQSKAFGRAVVEALGLTRETIHEIETIPYYKLARACQAVGGMHWGPVKDDGFYFGSGLLNPFRPESKDKPMLVGSVLGEFDQNYNHVYAPGSKNDWDDALVDKLFGELFGDKAQEVKAAQQQAYPQAKAADALFTNKGGRTAARDFCFKRAAEGCAPAYNWLFNLECPLNSGTIPWHNAEEAYMFHNARYLEASYIPGVSEELQDIMTGAWVAFAQTGDPNHIGMKQWDPATQENGACMIFDRETRQENHHDDALMEALPDKPVMHDNSREPETTFGGGPRQSL